MKAIIIDDEIDAREVLKLEIERNCDDVDIISMCSSAKEGLQAIKNVKPDLIFLDIDMPYMDGFELLELAQPGKYKIIFVTAFDEYAIKAFKTSAVDFLLKPVITTELVDAVDKIRSSTEFSATNHYSFLSNQIHDIRKNNLNKIITSTIDGYDLISIDNIIYLNSDDSYTHLHLKLGKKHTVSKNLKHFQEYLPEDIFFRCHKSYMINLNHMDRIIKSQNVQVVMKGGDKISIARSKKDEFFRLVRSKNIFI